MSEKIKARTISFLSIPAAALAVLIGLASSESRLQLSDPLAVCATTKGALCGAFGDQSAEGTRYASVPDLGQLTVSARRNVDTRSAATNSEGGLLGSMTITATRLPSDRLAQAPAASGHSY